jgi:hypothetical protein
MQPSWVRPNRIKYRDLWDIYWLHLQNSKPANEPYKAGMADDMFWKSLVIIVNNYCEKIKHTIY